MASNSFENPFFTTEKSPESAALRQRLDEIKSRIGSLPFQREVNRYMNRLTQNGRVNPREYVAFHVLIGSSTTGTQFDMPGADSVGAFLDSLQGVIAATDHLRLIHDDVKHPRFEELSRALTQATHDHPDWGATIAFRTLLGMKSNANSLDPFDTEDGAVSAYITELAKQFSF